MLFLHCPKPSVLLQIGMQHTMYVRICQGAAHYGIIADYQ